MSGPTGAVKSSSAGFTLKTDMSPMGDVAKAKAPEEVATKAVGDGFEPAKTEEPKAMAKAQGGGGPLQQTIARLKRVHAALQRLAQALPPPFKQVVQAAADKLKKFINFLERIANWGFLPPIFRGLTGGQ